MTEGRQPGGRSAGAAYVFLALTAAAVRLLPLQFLHPLNWDELEFYRATRWIAEGRVPYRDFWEHHTPLAWFLFAPFSLLTDTPGVQAVIAMRWAQIAVWIGTFALLNVWMRNAGVERAPRWMAMGLALCSSLFMIPAVEYRVESVGCLLFVLGLVLAQRNRDFLAGLVWCLAGFANLRLGPVLVVALLLHIVSGSGLQGAESWRMKSVRAVQIIAGGFAGLTACLAYFAATGALDELWQQVWIDNLGEKFASPVEGGFLHRLLVPFGVRILASDRLFEWAAVDVGGILVLVLGFVGMLLAWRHRQLRTMAILQLVNVLFVSSMKFIYNYHLALAAILAIPLIAFVVQRMPMRSVVVALLVLAWGVNAFAAIFRGKENDLAYQDRIMREVHARTLPGEKVWSGVPWALRREPSYRFWFLPELARQLVLQRLAPRYVMTEPPAAIVFDHYALIWAASVQRELAPYIVRHYMPAWRNLWIPAMNGIARPGETIEWIVPRDGTYRLFASPEIAAHPWFRDPARAYRQGPFTPRGLAHPPVRISSGPFLKKGQRVTLTSYGSEPLGIILLPGVDTVLFQQPGGGATLEAETTRVTHVPDL